ncbi:hypothetical protein AGMMS50249_5050 [candidate division SR1 bacterium]|nr:hypothetical protein AGMMS50249_5050 [candidate division SR1 bacterium]
MKSPLTTLPNIGPVIADKLIKIGITTPDQFLSRDPYEIFYQLKTKIDPTLCRCALASIIGASKGVKRNTIHKSSAIEFEARYPDLERKTTRKGC